MSAKQKIHSDSKRPKREFRSPAYILVYEDNFILVVNKRAGFLSVPAGGGRTQKKGEVTLISEIKRYLSIKSGRDTGATPVHRLDRDTSGLLVIAKSQKVSERIKEQFKARKPEREYAAIVRGRVEKDQGTFKSFLATDDDLNQYSTKDEKDGKLAITHFEVLARYADATRVKVSLETGRRNQIRVHFAEIGHPVLGDVRYEIERARHPDWRYPRLALHAGILGFYHPMAKKNILFEAQLPEEFNKFFAANEPK